MNKQYVSMKRIRAQYQYATKQMSTTPVPNAFVARFSTSLLLSTLSVPRCLLLNKFSMTQTHPSIFPSNSVFLLSFYLLSLISTKPSGSAFIHSVTHRFIYSLGR
ncbi:unnamed protein product [Trichobilharzia szidati]|nr:unnamed protein product [Trichobilharzia szidati]